MDDDDGELTPRMSGTLQMAPTFIAAGNEAADRLQRLALRKRKVLAEIDMAGSRHCSDLELELRMVVAEIEQWESMDPGPDARREQIAKLLDLRAQAEELAPITMSAHR